MKHWYIFLSILILVFASQVIFGNNTISFPTTVYAQDGKKADDKKVEAKSFKRSITAEFLHDRSGRLSKFYVEASTKGEGWWVTTKETVENLRKVHGYWLSKAEEFTKDKQLSAVDKALVDVALIDVRSANEILENWVKVAPSRWQSRFDDEADRTTEDFRWHRPHFEVKADGSEEDAAKVYIEYADMLAGRWNIYRDAHKPDAKGTTDIIDQTGLLRWAIVKKDIACRIYRDGEWLWRLHSKTAEVVEAFLKASGASLKEETKKALEEKAKGMKGCAEEFGKLYNPPKEEEKKADSK